VNPAKSTTRQQRRLLLACLVIVVLASWLASQVQTAGGRVQVESIKIPAHNGQWVVADLFKPRSATAESPAPFIVVVPGFQRSKEALSNIALELARRGFVTASIDPYAQGGSSASLSRRAATTEGYGMFALVDYAASTPNLNYIDRSKIGATGHSAGGNAAIRGANYFGREAQRTGQPSKLDSVYVSGYVLTLTDEVLRDVRSNVGVSYAFYDEGAYRNELGNGDMRVAPEALRTVNSGLPAEAAVSVLDLGTYYGDKRDRTLRVVHNERVLHPFQPYIEEATANQIVYFETVFDVDSTLSPYDQVWQWKEILGVVALIAALASRSLVHPVPKALPAPAGKGRVLFWATFTVAAVIACFSYIPMAELSQKIFVAASTRQLTWFFPQRMNNAVMLWAVLNGSVGFLMFWLTFRYFGRHNGITPEHWGVKTSIAELGRTLGLAVLLFACFFLVLFAVYYFLHVDYRFLFMGVRVFQPELLLLLAMYVPFFFIFFLSNPAGMAQHAFRRRCKFAGADPDRHCAVHDVCNNGNGLLDRRLAVRQPVVRGCTHDVRAAVLQPLFLPDDREDLPWADGHLSYFRDGTDHEYGHLPAPLDMEFPPACSCWLCR
jgi:hypothetical protein